MEGPSEKDSNNILDMKKGADLYSVCAHAGIYEKREHQRQANWGPLAK